MQSELTFYRDPKTPISGTTPSSSWKYPGMALSASSVRIYPGKMVKSATWFLVWNPNAGQTYNAVRLIEADNGPTNESQIASINRKETNSPVVDGVDITIAINAIIASGNSKQVLMQTCGDSESQIYRSSIDLVWEEE